MKKVSSALLGCFYWLAALSFTYVFFMAFFWNREGLLPLLIGFPLFFAVLLGLAQLLNTRGQQLFLFLENPKKRAFTVLVLLALFALIDFWVGTRLMIDTTQEPWDIWVVRSSAAWVADHPFAPKVENIAYFQRCENNRFVLAFLSLWYILGRFIFKEPNYELLGVVLNTLCTTAAMGFTYLAAKNFFGIKSAFVTLTSWFLFLPFYSYASIYYTDTLCLPFITLATLFLSLFYKSRQPLWLIGAGIFMGLGCQMKGTLYIFLIAGLIFLLFMDGLRLGKRLLCLGLCVLSIVGSVFGFLSFYSESGLFGEEPNDHIGMALPVTHYLAMAQSANGPYDHEMRQNVIAMGNTYEVRSKKCWDDFYGILKTRGLLTNLVFTNKKVVAVWGEGSYQTNQYPREYAFHPDSFFFRWMAFDHPDSGSFYLFCNIFHFSMLLAMLATLWHRVIRRRFVADGLFLCQLSLFGMFLFELFWEWRSRYLMGYVPMLLCMLPLGVGVCLSVVRKIRLPGFKHSVHC